MDESADDQASTSLDDGIIKENLFRDGIRPIDFVLLHETNDKEYNEWRKRFEEELRLEGIEIEYEMLENKETVKRKEKSSIFSKSRKTKKNSIEENNEESESEKNGIMFVKLHAPWKTLCKWAELTRMHKPIAENDVIHADTNKRSKCSRKRWMKGLTLDSERLTERGYAFDTQQNKKSYFTSPFDRARMARFMIGDQKTFFTSTERIRLVDSILKTTKYSDTGVGMHRLLSIGAYLDAYPLHLGEWKLPETNNKNKCDAEHPKVRLNARQTLYWLWSRPGAWIYHQPLELIRQYFGEKIGVYFAWLGFYTEALIPVAFFGLLTFIYGLATVEGDEIQKQICNSDLKMCPLCDTCKFNPLNHSCFYSKITYVFDNTMTVAFAFIMCLWGQFFLEFWKRKRSELGYLWDTNSIRDEEGLVRPEYEIIANKKKLNPVTGKEELYLSSASKYKRTSASFVTFLFMILLVLAALFGIIVYRTILAQVAFYSTSGFIHKNARLIISVTASLINFIIITIMDVIYQKIAVGLTSMEAPRTQQQFEDSYTLKMFLFQAVNYYSSTFYAAFFRGRFVGTPKEYHRLFGFRLDMCDPAGCLVEVFINLAMVMVLKQALNNTKEILIPIISNWMKSRKSKQLKAERLGDTEDSGDNIINDAENKMTKQPAFRDFTLEPFGELGLFSEYLEMVIQYGFVTLFVTAFPLGPVFALINNVIEIRLDAYKFVTQYRRILPNRSRDIGMWFSILQGISTAAVITNAVLIGITSNFIQKTVYVFLYSPCAKTRDTIHNCLDGFVMSTLNNISVTEINTINHQYDVSLPEVPSYCWFETSDPNEHYTGVVNHWHVYAATFIFILIFEHLVFGLKMLVDALIPDVPQRLVIQSRRQRLMETRLFYDNKRSSISGPSFEHKYENEDSKDVKAKLGVEVV